MSFTRFSCPCCQASLRLPESAPANRSVRCPKCGECFHTPTSAEDSARDVSPTGVSTAPRSPAIVPESEGTALRNISRPARRSRRMLWIVLGSLASGLLLLLIAASIVAAVWMKQSTVTFSVPPQARVVPPAGQAPPPARPARAPAAETASALKWFKKGNLRMQQGDLDGAVAAYTQAIELDPRLAGAYCNRGLARSNKGDLDGGIADSTKSIELNPRDPFPFINRANARIRKGVDAEASIADASHALELRPGIPAALLNLGMARDLKGDYDGALAAFDEALTLLPTFECAYNQRG